MMGLSLSLGSALAVGLIVVVSLLTGGGNQTPNVLDGHRLAPFTLTGLQGSTVGTPWSTGHPTVVVFFASWCGPCKIELPQIANYAARHELGNVRFLGIDVNDQNAAAQAFVRAAHVRFPVGVDPQSQLSSREFKLPGLPDTVFVNGNGLVTNVVIGPISMSELAVDINDNH